MKMAKTGISEFTYGFAFLHEQANRNEGNLISAPILPSLIQEQEEGWDAKLPLIGGAYFYQFKLADYLSRTNARFHRGKPYYSPYYCFSLHRNNRNQQHNRLKQLSLTEQNTFYVAPEFNGEKTFNKAYLNGEVSKRSRIIPLTECHFINDAKQHYITYQTHNQVWAQHSKIKKSELSYKGDQLERIHERAHDRLRPIDFAFALDLYRNISSPLYNGFEMERIKLSEEELAFLHLSYQNKTIKTVLQHTAKVLSIFYGATLVLVGTGRD